MHVCIGGSIELVCDKEEEGSLEKEEDKGAGEKEVKRAVYVC